MPRSSTSAPPSAAPSRMAAAIVGDDTRMSWPTAMRAGSNSSTNARPMRYAPSSSSSVPYRPRTSYALKAFGSSTRPPYSGFENVADDVGRLGRRRFGDDGRRPVEAGQSVAQRLGSQSPLAVREMLRLVAVRELDVREVDMERRPGLDHGVGLGERLDERADRGERAVGRCVHVGEVDDRTHPAEAR